MAKRRYFLKDPKGRYRGLVAVTPDHADTLRNKGWTVMAAGTPFRKIHPWTGKAQWLTLRDEKHSS